MLNTSSTAPADQQGYHDLLNDINALVSGWDTSRSAAELIVAVSDRFKSEPHADETAAINGKKKGGKCMSRRPGQDGRNAPSIVWRRITVAQTTRDCGPLSLEKFERRQQPPV